MWVFLREAFVSIVAHRDKPGVLLVRARLAGDIERAFAGYRFKVRRTPRADYLYRAALSFLDVREALANHVNAIDYDNFKAGVGPDRRETYSKVWDTMRERQDLGRKIVAARRRRRR